MIKSIQNFWFIVFLISCSNIPKDASIISSLIEISYQTSQEIRAGGRIDIVLKNETDYCLVFPFVDGLSIYTENRGKKIEVKNLISVIGDQGLILSPKGEPLSSRILILQPDTSEVLIEGPTSFFVELKGYLCDDKSFVIVKTIPFTIVP